MQPVNGHPSLSTRPPQSFRRSSRCCNAASLSNELAVASEIQDECSDSSSAAERDRQAASLEEILKEKGECGVSKTIISESLFLESSGLNDMQLICSRMGWGTVSRQAMSRNCVSCGV